MLRFFYGIIRSRLYAPPTGRRTSEKTVPLDNNCGYYRSSVIFVAYFSLMITFSQTPISVIITSLIILMSGYALIMNPRFITQWALSRKSIVQDRQWYRIITSGFVHAGFLHLIFNLVTFYSFGPVMEIVLGKTRFLILYFGSEILATVFSLHIRRNHPEQWVLGASGAISGIICSYCLFFPLKPIYMIPIPIGIPSIFFAILFLSISTYITIQSKKHRIPSHIAHEAHLGGAVGGIIISFMLVPKLPIIFLNALGISL